MSRNYRSDSRLLEICPQSFTLRANICFKNIKFSRGNYVTNRFHVALRLFSNRSQMTSKCGKNKKWDTRQQPIVSMMFLPHFDVLCDLLLNRRTATWNLFVLYSRETRKVQLTTAYGQLYRTYKVSPTLYQTDLRISNHRGHKFPQPLKLLLLTVRPGAKRSSCSAGVYFFQFRQTPDADLRSAKS